VVVSAVRASTGRLTVPPGRRGNLKRVSAMGDERSETARFERTSSVPLGGSTQWGLGLVGAACICAGGLAVFIADNVAGALGLLVVGVTLVVTASMGIVPTRVKIGGSGLVYEASYVEGTQETLVEAIGRPGVSLEVRRTVSDTIVDFNEQFMARSGVVPQFARQLATQAYRISVLAALRRTLSDAEVIEPPPASDSFDFVVRTSDKDIYVECALGTSTSSGPMPAEIVRYLLVLQPDFVILRCGGPGHGAATA
jgi:hypothetical protein